MDDSALLEQARSIAGVIRLLRRHIVNCHQATANESGSDRCGDFTLPQLNMLMVVRERQSVTIKDLAGDLGVSAPSVSTMVDRLVDQGALTREQSRADRREVIVSITPGMDEILESAERQILQVVINLLREMGPEFSRQWCDVYQRIREIIEMHNRSPLPAASSTEEGSPQ